MNARLLRYLIHGPAYTNTVNSIWDAYYCSYLQVVNGLSITIANYVLNAYSLTSYFPGPFVALYVHQIFLLKIPEL